MAKQKKSLVWYVIPVVILLAIVAAVFYQYKDFATSMLVASKPAATEAAQSSQEQTTQPTTAQQTTPEQTSQPPQGQAAGEQTTTIIGTVQTPEKNFTVHGLSYRFNPSSITVDKGDKVKITFISDDVTHDLCIDAYGCTQRIANGGSSTLEFTASQSGTFPLYCSVDAHRAFGMEGSLVVQ